MNPVPSKGLLSLLNVTSVKLSVPHSIFAYIFLYQHGPYQADSP